MEFDLSWLLLGLPGAFVLGWIAPRPDLLVILTLDPKDGVARVNHRGQSNLFEREEDLRRSAAIFAAITDPTPLRLDATQPREAITDAIVAALRDLGAL